MKFDDQFASRRAVAMTCNAMVATSQPLAALAGLQRLAVASACLSTGGKQIPKNNHS
jgi:hypothetical protein